MSNSLGNIFKIQTFGESHGKAIGVIIDGCPSNIEINEDLIQKELDRRKPGQSKITTQRKESDTVQVLSGIFEGKTTGTPIALMIENSDQKSKDYDHLKNVYRPSHADFTYQEKYENRDYRGGGRTSARETANWVSAGSIAKQFLKSKSQIEIYSYVEQVGKIKLDKDYSELDLTKIDGKSVRCPDSKIASEMEEYILDIKKQGDTVGGIIKGVIKNVPIRLGEPIFNKLHADLGKAMLSINAAKGFEFGSGFSSVEMLGSEHNDLFIPNSGGKTKTNHSGGIQGGISNGMDITFRVAFKPVATLIQKQDSIDSDGNSVILDGKGRHDPCVVPRAVPIVDALSWLVLADFFLLNKIQDV